MRTTSSMLLGFEEWVDIFHPIPNNSPSATSPSLEIDGVECLLGVETYGADFEKILSTDPSYVWTLTQEEEVIYIKPGVLMSDRLAYLITETPWSSEEEVYLYASEDELD